MISIGPVEAEIWEKRENRPLHFSLIDPDKTKPDQASKLAKLLEEMGTDAILVGGSIGVCEEELDEVVRRVKENVSIPVILFPGNVSGISRYADAILFMTLMNSTNPYFITRAQLLGAAVVRKYNLEAIPTGYIIVGAGGAAGYIGYAQGVPPERPEIGALYVLTAKYMGMRFAYLEAGSGAPSPVPPAMIRLAREYVGRNEIIMVGGGIRRVDDVKRAVSAGADIVVTGTLIEEDVHAVGNLVKAVREARRWAFN